VPMLMAENNLTNPDQIYAGEVLTVSCTPAITGAVATGSVYVVQPGDTLSAISRRFGVSLSALAGANNIVDPSAIAAGQRLVLPGAGGSASASAGIVDASAITTQASSVGSDYVVQPGDTLSAISARYGSTPEALAAANNMSVASILRVGTQLSIPTGGSMQASSAVQTGSGDIGAILTAQAEASGVDPALVKAVAWQESGWQMVTAADGGIGIMQLMPDSVAWVSSSLLGYQINPYDPTDNVRGGVAMLRYYLRKYGDVTDALAAYHQGMGSLATQGILPETQQYIANILALQQRFAAQG
jgi:LysM repeat protein